MHTYSARQQEIMSAATCLIANRGIQNLTMKNLAAEIGVSEPAIYRHFKSKHDILCNVVQSFQTASLSVLKDHTINALKPLDKLESFIMSRYEICASDQNLAKVIFSEENFQNDEDLSKRVLHMMHSHRDLISGIVKEAQNSGEIRVDIEIDSLFRIIFGPVRLLIKQWCLNGFAFSIIDEGRRLWAAEKILITTIKQ